MSPYPVIVLAQIIIASLYLAISAIAVFGAYVGWHSFGLPRPEIFAAIVFLICLIGAIAFVVSSWS